MNSDHELYSSSTSLDSRFSIILYIFAFDLWWDGGKGVGIQGYITFTRSIGLCMPNSAQELCSSLVLE